MEKKSESLFLDVRGLRYHVRRWGDPEAPALYMLHGWMDVSASFQFLVDALRGDWCVIAPDWRGFGDTQWSGTQSYWFPDYLADLDRLLELLHPGQAVTLVGHSMGGNVACLYAGIRPERVARLINLEGLGVSNRSPEEALTRYRRWLDELAATPAFRTYPDFESFARRLRERYPRLAPERAAFVARHWARQAQSGEVVLRADPAHKRVNPVLYRLPEAMACWRAVRAPVLWVEGGESEAAAWHNLTPEEIAERRACFASIECATIAEAGHMLHLEQPEALARLIEDFLARKAAAGA
nr:MAG: alpha/beta hydrolase [Pseudomonadota bacterium]